jgi:hypothetical protein
MNRDLYMETPVFIYSTLVGAGNRLRIRFRQRVGQVPLTPFEREDFYRAGDPLTFAI